MGKYLGGVHPDGHKELACEKAFVPYLPKGDMVFPMGQHIGKPAVPVVKKGDEVKAGQIIGEASGFVSANIVSSVSGTVMKVESNAVTIKNDGLYTLADGVGKECSLDELSPSEIISKISAAGVVGMGGAGFPTHVKLSVKDPSTIDHVIANGAECEPYITCDDRLMREKSKEVIMGLQAALKLFPEAKGVVIIEDNKPEAIKAMTAAAEGTGIVIKPVEARYPQGGERQIIQSATGRQLAGGKLPAELGCVVDNVATLYAIYNAVYKSTPLMERGFTVSGDAIAEPSNLWIKIGTQLSELIEACGGFKEEPEKLLLGGPMMGAAIYNINVPVVKNNNALTSFFNDPVERAELKMTACIRCGMCIQSCPIGLYPQVLGEAVEKKDFDRFEKAYGMHCMFCGSCTYACPAKRPLVHLFKLGKNQVMANKAAQKGGK